MSSAATKKTQENMNQKLALVIKSGKFRLGTFRNPDYNLPL
jgi:ribosomal protein L30E